LLLGLDELEDYIAVFDTFQTFHVPKEFGIENDQGSGDASKVCKQSNEPFFKKLS
jgi:hypothetical protein